MRDKYTDIFQLLIAGVIFALLSIIFGLVVETNESLDAFIEETNANYKVISDRLDDLSNRLTLMQIEISHDVDDIESGIANITEAIESIDIPDYTTLFISPSSEGSEETSVSSDNSQPRVGYGEFTDKDIDLLYRCVEAEETGNSYRCKYLAASCIVNRYKKGWSKSIAEVITVPRQFEVVANNRINTVAVTESTIKACNDALDNPEAWVIAFSMGDLHSSWCNLVETIDGEYFYKER